MKTPFAILSSLMVILFFSSCSDEYVGDCNQGKFIATLKNDRLKNTPFQEATHAPSQNIVEFRYFDNGEIRIGIGTTIDYICPEQEVEIVFHLKTTQEIQDKPFTIVAGANWQEFLSATSSTIFAPFDPVTSDTVYMLRNNAGIHDLLPRESGSIDVFIGVDFASSGDFSTDSAYFVNHIEYLSIDVIADKY